MRVDLAAHKSEIEAALSHAEGSHTFEDIQAAVEAGSLQYWPGPRSVIITEIQQYPRKRSLHFFLAGGVMAELEAMYPLVEHWGKLQGCTMCSMTGRKGWEKSFLTRKEGWSPLAVVFMKDLQDVSQGE